MTIDQIINVVAKYLRMAASLALIVLVLLIIARVLGFNIWPLSLADYQQTGILIAGLAYALRG
jgi:archaellum biogenesis protein FlaJ (TadC family)